MEYMVYNSIKKHRIIAVKNLLENNNIPISSIKLSIHTTYGGHNPKNPNTVTMQRRDDIIVDIEDFDDNINSDQIFELYTNEKYYDISLRLIGHHIKEIFLEDYIFRTNDYGKAEEIYSLLLRNKIQSDEIYIDITECDNEEYLIFIDFENIEKSKELIEKHFKRSI